MTATLARPHHGDMTALAGRLDAGEVDPPHAHDHAQLALCLSGVINVTVEGACHVLRPNRAIWIPPRCHHGASASTDACFQYALIEPDDGLPDQCRIFEATPLFRSLIDEIVMSCALGNDAARRVKLVDLLLTEVGRMPDNVPPVPLPRDPRLRRICETIVADPGNPRTLEDWADSLQLSRRAFTRLCSDELGTGFATWRRQVRMKHAAARIMAGEAIGDVASDIGYENPSAFSALFRRTFGKNARAYCRT